MESYPPLDEAMAALTSGTASVVMMIVYILAVIAMWKMFTKAGYAGILAIIPLVNVIILLKIANYSGWLVLLYFIPIVGVIFAIMVAFRLGRNFGKGGFFSFIWLWLFPIIGYFILGFGSAQYRTTPGGLR